MIKSQKKIGIYIAAVSLLAVFIIDIITPTEFIADILYLCCIALVFKENARTIIIFSAIACLLIITDLLVCDINLKLSLFHWINRGMSIVAILITSYIAILYRNSSQAAILKERQYLKALEAMLFITSHQVRKPVANIMGLVEVINNDSIILTESDLKNSCRHLLCSASELDSVIKELSLYIEQTEHENNSGNLLKPAITISTKTRPTVHPKIERLKLAIKWLSDLYVNNGISKNAVQAISREI
jgi:hypothetical protein